MIKRKYIFYAAIVAALLVFMFWAIRGSQQKAEITRQLAKNGAGEWRLRWPQRLSADAKGNLYVVDRFVNNKKDHYEDGYHIKDVILKISPSGRLVERFDLGKQSVIDMAVSPQGTVYYLIYKNGKDNYFVMQISSDPRKRQSFRLPPLQKTPRGLAVGNNAIYVVYEGELGKTIGSSHISKISKSGRLLAKWELAFPVSIAYGIIRHAKFITSDDNGRIYVLEFNKDSQQMLIERFDQDNTPVLLQFSLEPEISFDVDKRGDIFLTGLDAAIRVTPKGRVLSRFKSKGLLPINIAVGGRYVFILMARNAGALRQIYRFALDGKPISTWPIAK